MVAPLPELPESPGELWDFLHERFGFGDYDELVSGGLYWQARAREVHRLKLVLRRRHTTVAELAKAGWWVGTEVSTTIRSPFGLLKHVPMAVRAWDRAQAEAQQAELDEHASHLLSEAMAHDPQRAEELMRMTPTELHALARKDQT